MHEWFLSFRAELLQTPQSEAWGAVIQRSPQQLPRQVIPLRQIHTQDIEWGYGDKIRSESLLNRSESLSFSFSCSRTPPLRDSAN